MTGVSPDQTDPGSSSRRLTHSPLTAPAAAAHPTAPLRRRPDKRTPHNKLQKKTKSKRFKPLSCPSVRYVLISQCRAAGDTRRRHTTRQATPGAVAARGDLCTLMPPLGATPTVWNAPATRASLASATSLSHSRSRSGRLRQLLRVVIQAVVGP